MASALTNSWAALQQEAGSDDGPLSVPVQAAGKGHPKLQKALTKQLEATLFQQLDVEIRASATMT